MTNTVVRNTFIGVLFILLSSTTYGSIIERHPIHQFYKEHRFDKDMEAKHIPPKLTSLFVEDDYREARDVLMALNSLKYLNYYGEKSKISEYAQGAVAAKGDYESLYDETEGNRSVMVFGERKGRNISKVFAVVETKTQFLLLIGKGNLKNSDLRKIPKLTKEIQ